MCVYCGGDATEVDHIIPYSYCLKHEPENLIASCPTCNRIASNKIFDSLAEKMLYIRKVRNQRRLKVDILNAPTIIESEEQITSNDLPDPKKFPSLKQLKQYLAELHEKYSYPKIAKAYNTNPAVIWRIVNSDYEPKKPETCHNFGLPTSATVIPISGEVAPGSYAVASKICIKCGKPFIPNSPKREKCQVCVPPRKRKK